MSESGGAPAIFGGKQIIKLLLEIGPLGVFFFSNAKWGIFTATAVFMVAILLSLVGSYVLMRRLPIMALVTGVFVLVFGGLTIYLENDLFIKLKPTLVNLLFAGALLGGLGFGKSLLRVVFGDFFRLTSQGWRLLTLRWGLFFLMLAVLNEIVWRNFSTDDWVSFKVFGILPLTMIFGIAQMGLLQRHELGADQAGNDSK
ncbi:MAG: septation protein A [Alphaproteobacteria bacterium]